MKTLFNIFMLVLLVQTNVSSQIFVEKEGLLVIEMESTTLSPGWVVSKEKFNPTGEGYIIWTGTDNFNNTGRGVLTYDIFINTPGKYRFEWRSGVGLGTLNTEHNDSWLKIHGDDFWGERGTETKCKPKPICGSSAGYICPAGSSVNNFFKIYGGQWNQFQWKSVTSDNNDHLIYAEFKTAGKYKIEINARSNSHMLDRMVMWDFNKYNISTIRNLSLPQSDIMVSNKDIVLSDMGISFYPNPAKTNLTIANFSDKEVAITIRSITGKVVYNDKSSQLDTVDISSWARGIYLIEASSGSSKATEKLVVVD